MSGCGAFGTTDVNLMLGAPRRHSTDTPLVKQARVTCPRQTPPPPPGCCCCKLVLRATHTVLSTQFSSRCVPFLVQAMVVNCQPPEALLRTLQQDESW